MSYLKQQNQVLADSMDRANNVIYDMQKRLDRVESTSVSSSPSGSSRRKNSSKGSVRETERRQREVDRDMERLREKEAEMERERLREATDSPRSPSQGSGHYGMYCMVCSGKRERETRERAR